MKKNILLLSVLMLVLLSLTACNNSSKIEGRWSAPDCKVKFNSEALDTTKYPFAESTTCTYNFTFMDNGTFTLSRTVPDDQKAVAVDGYKKLYRNLYENKHSADEIQKKISETEGCSNIDELIDILLYNAAKQEGFASVSDFICNELRLNNTEIYSGEYKAKGSKITLTTDGEDSKEIVASYKDNTISLTIYGDEVKFSPVSLDKDK